MTDSNKEETKHEIVFDQKVHEGLLKGAKKLADAVKITMGPSGKNVIIQRTGEKPVITKDGVTVAKAVSLKNPLERIGAELIKEVSSKTNETSGDGPQPLYSKVLTPHGWTTMGELKIGDEICGTNGTKQKVLEIYPKGLKQIVQITTYDNRTVECCEDHLWKITTKNGKEKILSTADLMKDYTKKSKIGESSYKYFIPISVVEFNNDNHLPLDPYFVGVLLGDGSLSEKSDIEISLGYKKEHIIEKLKLPNDCNFSKTLYKKKNSFKITFNKSVLLNNSLIELGLLGTNSYTKFIPKSYLFSSIKNRKKLLQGLLDTDGHINTRGLFEYSTVNKQLFLDFIELCRSLGIQTYQQKLERKPGNGSYSNRPIYRVIQLKGYKHGIKISKIEILKKQTEMQCIKVSNDDHLYITDDYLTTHNTTTATVLAYEMLSSGIKALGSGASPVALKQGMDKATEFVVGHLKNNCVPVKERKQIEHVGTISANGDTTIGTLLAEAIEKVGEDGVVTIEQAKSFQTTLEVAEGMQIESGFISPFFVTNSEKQNCELENPLVLLTTRKISTVKELLPVLETAHKQRKPLLIIADDIEGEALHTLVVNKINKVISVCAIKAPSYGDYREEILSDIAILSGASVVHAASGDLVNQSTSTVFGSLCKKIVVTKQSTTFVANQSDKTVIEERLKELRTRLLDDTLSLDDLQKQRLKTRIAKLSGGVAVVKVGGSTEVEMLERKDRVEDALNATQAAVKEGIVPGGGMALYNAAMALEAEFDVSTCSEDERVGVSIIKKTCLAPFKQIVENTGKNFEVVAEKLLTQKSSTTFGYNAATHKFTDLIQEGVLDPVKVTRSALEYSNSVVGLMLTCECIVFDENI